MQHAVQKGDDSRRFLSKEECEALAATVLSVVEGGGETSILIRSRWHGELRWARNRVSLASDRRNITVTIRRIINDAVGSITTNQEDVKSLTSAVKAAERIARRMSTKSVDLSMPPVEFVYPQTLIWNDQTFHISEAVRGNVVRDTIAPVENASMFTAGFMEVSASGVSIITSEHISLYAPLTSSRFSLTVRDPEQTGSGWAGISSHDWRVINPTQLGSIALEKCLNSRNPVALEPGRYSTILESQATCDLVQLLISSNAKPLDRANAESGRGPFADRPGFSRLGQQVVDKRVTIFQDPTDPQLGVVPFDSNGEPILPVQWIKDGVLNALSYDRAYALSRLNQPLGLPNSNAFKMKGGNTTREEMISSTRRGILVTRFSGLEILDQRSLTSEGYTRDGLWLIEKGKITRAIKNFRVMMSPIFALNNIEAIGEAQLTFRPSAPAIVPDLMIRDFHFHSLVDAV